MGYNGTIFAYGQTSSGKTHTMEGVIGKILYQSYQIQVIIDYVLTKVSKFSFIGLYFNIIFCFVDLEKLGLGRQVGLGNAKQVRGQ